MSISLLNTLFYVSAAIAALGLFLSVFFFFYFDIPTVRAMMTGRVRQETVRRMAELNARTGRLRTEKENSGRLGRSGRLGKSGKLGNSGRLGRSGRLGKTEETAAAEQVHINPTVYQHPQRLDTSVLTVETPDTAVLDTSQAETVILNRPGQDPQPQPAAAPVAVNTVAFCVTETTLVIHTDEIL